MIIETAQDFWEEGATKSAKLENRTSKEIKLEEVKRELEYLYFAFTAETGGLASLSLLPQDFELQIQQRMEKNDTSL